jgi:hypothetical protein
MKSPLFALPLAILAITAYTSGDDNSHNAPISKYAGEENQAIKSLSPADIDELRRGGGWGLAKAAELNGVPGPTHLIELKDKIPLSGEQVTAVTKVFNAMNAQARSQGEILIGLESELETHFRNRTITDELLRKYLHAIGQARTELRYIHLSAHLETPGILTERQIARYNALRGYGDKDPCANAPEGHNLEMWRKHNGCD